MTPHVTSTSYTHTYTITSDGKAGNSDQRSTHGVRPVIEVSNIDLLATDPAAPHLITITFDSQGGNNIDNRVIESYKRYDTLPIPEKEGYVFNGWYTDPVNGEQIYKSTFSPISDVTYYAHWTNRSLLGKAVYYDPVSTNTCNGNTYSIEDIKAGTSTCYRWRIVSQDPNNKYNVQLDHDLTTSSFGTDYTKGPDTILTTLATSTSNWSRVPLLNYRYDTRNSNNPFTNQLYGYGILTCTNGSCVASRSNTTIATNVRARVITVDEVVTLMNLIAEPNAASQTWEHKTDIALYFSNASYKVGTTTGGEGDTSLSWLIENMTENANSGSTNNSFGNNTTYYWTMTPDNRYSSSTYYKYAINTVGSVNNIIRPNSNYGLRPIIQLNESDLVFES